jgi:hypothetical protein
MLLHLFYFVVWLYWFCFIWVGLEKFDLKMPLENWFRKEKKQKKKKRENNLPSAGGRGPFREACSISRLPAWAAQQPSPAAEPAQPRALSLPVPLTGGARVSVVSFLPP